MVTPSRITENGVTTYQRRHQPFIQLSVIFGFGASAVGFGSVTQQLHQILELPSAAALHPYRARRLS